MGDPRQAPVDLNGALLDAADTLMPRGVSDLADASLEVNIELLADAAKALRRPGGRARPLRSAVAALAGITARWLRCLERPGHGRPSDEPELPDLLA
jgi:hypothetical protein